MVVDPGSIGRWIDGGSPTFFRANAGADCNSDYSWRAASHCVGGAFSARLAGSDTAFCAVLALWSVYILVFEPVERRLYDTRTFSRAAFALVQKDPAPLVLHAMGKDAKAIKFMVNIEQDLQPVFTESIQELENLQRPAWLMMDESDYRALQGTPLGALPPILSGRFDKNDYILLHLNPL